MLKEYFFAQNCFLGDVTKYHTNFYGISRFFPLYSNFVKYVGILQGVQNGFGPL